MKEVPDAPKEQVVIDDGVAQINLKKWIDFFGSMSPRIKIIKPTDKNFSKTLKIIEEHVVDNQGISNPDGFDWPDDSDVAFVLLRNMSSPGHKGSYKIDDCYIFLFGNKAFAPDYIQIESEFDEETGEWEHGAPEDQIFSLNSYSSEALSWSYISKLIKKSLEELEEEIPDFPETA